jgi:uncharacterized protein (TIGR00299 family) protein
MLLGSLIDAGADVEKVRAGLVGLGIEGWTLTALPVRRGSFAAVHAEIRVDGQEEAGGPDVPDHPHDHAHHHDHHDHAHHHDHDHHGQDHPARRTWRDIRALLERAPLPDRVRARALATFSRLARAEAHLHGMPVDDVELHEVGGVDAIIDIVGTCLALERLGVDVIVATPLPLGTGHVQAAHGTLPLPAPATLQVLIGWPVVPSRWPGEWVTPTGASLLAALGTPGPLPAMTVRATGHGAGRRDPPQVANLVRVVIGDSAQPPRSDTVVELACNIDDGTGELVAPLVQDLLDAGALDAWITPVLMKKGRPGFLLQALALPETADALGELLLRRSTTLGVRRHRSTRQILDRWFETTSTPYGPVRMKVGGRDGVSWHAAPEFEDVAARAREAGVPAMEVHRAALGSWSPRDLR